MITGPFASSSVGKPNNDVFWRFMDYVQSALMELERKEQAERLPQEEAVRTGEDSEVKAVTA